MTGSQYQVYRELDPDLLKIMEEILGFSAMALVETMQKGDEFAFLFAFQYPDKTPHPDLLWTTMKMILREKRAMAPRMKRVTGGNVRAAGLLSRAFLGYPWSMVVSDKDKDKRRGVATFSDSAFSRARRALRKRDMQERMDSDRDKRPEEGTEGRLPKPVGDK